MFQNSKFPAQGWFASDRKIQNSNGFTLLELLIVIAIFMIMLGIAIAITKSFSNTVNLDNYAKIIGTNIKLAKTRSVGALNDTNYGVHFEGDKITVFGVSDSTTDKVVNLSDDVEIYDISLAGGGVDLVFNRLTGVTANPGSIGIQLVNDTSEKRQIIINEEGQIDYVSFPTSSESPIKNARHVHYDLGWNIESSETLRLKWTGSFGTVINDIDTAAYFNGSEFDWYEITEVNKANGGTDQSLRVRGWLDGINTMLCIIRDQTEEYTLDIYFIDGAATSRVVTYVAEIDGTVSVIPDLVYEGTTIK